MRSIQLQLSFYEHDDFLVLFCFAFVAAGIYETNCVVCIPKYIKNGDLLRAQNITIKNKGRKREKTKINNKTF